MAVSYEDREECKSFGNALNRVGSSLRGIGKDDDQLLVDSIDELIEAMEYLRPIRQRARRRLLTAKKSSTK